MTENNLTVAVRGALNTERDIKPANPRRGAARRHLAIDFVQQWPIGSTLTWDEFIQWALEHDLIDIETLPTEEEAADKQSNAWMAHLQRRHQALVNLNKAASYPDLNPYGGAYLVKGSGGALVVRSTASALAETEAPQRIASLATTHRKQLQYLVQSTDWEQLPAHERGLAEAIIDDIDDWVESLDLRSQQLHRKFLKLRSKLEALVLSGDITPTNGGISGLIEHYNQSPFE